MDKNSNKRKSLFPLKTIKLFLDDIREPSFFDGYDGYAEPLEWVIVRSVEAAKRVLETRQVSHLSLDHDLGDKQPTGYDLCKWMSRVFTWPDNILFHSLSQSGHEAMSVEYQSYISRQVKRQKRSK